MDEVVVRRGNRLFTRSCKDGSLRKWVPYHSKLAALLLKDRNFHLPRLTGVLYLGGGHGTTVSHLSDIMTDGSIFVIEYGITMEEVIMLAQQRSNILPIMEDANQPDRYSHLIPKKYIDLLYQDVAQPNQCEILLKNFHFLAVGGIFILMLKVRSVSQMKDPDEILDGAMNELKNHHAIIIEGSASLAPSQKDHFAIWGRKDS